MDHVTYQWVTSHINGSRHISISHVTYWRVTSHINESRHISMSHVTYQSVTPHVHMILHLYTSIFPVLRRGILIATWYFKKYHDPCHTYKCQPMSRIKMSWHPYVWHESCEMSNKTSLCVTWVLVYIYIWHFDVWHFYVWPESCDVYAPAILLSNNTHNCILHTLVRYKVAKMHRIPQVAGLFPPKSHQS